MLGGFISDNAPSRSSVSDLTMENGEPQVYYFIGEVRPTLGDVVSSPR